MFGIGQKQRQSFEMILTEADFTVEDHQILPSTSEWQTIAYYECKAQQELHPGSGNPNQDENEGRVYAFFRTGHDTPLEIPGKWRIVLTDASDLKKVPIMEFDNELTHGDLNDKKKMIPLPYKAPGISEDSILKIQIKPSSAHIGAGANEDNIGWADNTESLLKIPVTIFV